MKKRGLAIMFLFELCIIPGVGTAPPGYNPNLSIEEQRRQEELLRRQRENQAKEAAQLHFDEDAVVEIKVHMLDAQTGQKLEGKVPYTFLNSGKSHAFVQADKVAYSARVRKISDILLIFQNPQYFPITESIPLSTLKPLERLEVSTRLLKKPDADGTATVDILFEADSAVLNPSYRDILLVFANTLKSNPTLSLVIKGYAGRDAATDEIARRISLSRASAIRDHLLKEGVQNHQLQAISMGIDDSEKETAREFRAELLLIDLND